MPIENLKKHAGQLSNTGVRVAVVFRKIPNDSDHCLIVETERLPDSYHDTIIQCLNSREAFETNEFYEVLNRRTFPDGLNCLTALHQRGFLRKEPVSNITMIPLPGHPVPLALINATIDKTVDQYVADEKKKSEAPVDTRTPEEKQAAAEELAKRMQEATSVAKETNSDPYQGDAATLAKQLLSKADALAAEAEALRETAYQAVPELRPGRGRPATPEELKEAKLEERKAKRREREQRKAAEARQAKLDESLDAKVAAKVKRDAARLSNS